MVVGALFLAKGVSGVGAMMQAVTLGTTWSHGGYSIRHGIFRDSTAAWRMTSELIAQKRSVVVVNVAQQDGFRIHKFEGYPNIHVYGAFIDARGSLYSLHAQSRMGRGESPKVVHRLFHLIHEVRIALAKPLNLFREACRPLEIHRGSLGGAGARSFINSSTELYR